MNEEPFAVLLAGVSVAHFNGAPKMVAIVLAAAMLHGKFQIRPAASVLITLGMVTRSWLAGRRVTRVLAEKITPMDRWEGFLANAVTAALVVPGAALGLQCPRLTYARAQSSASDCRAGPQ
jgi:phosphate/sulfate permease